MKIFENTVVLGKGKTVRAAKAGDRVILQSGIPFEPGCRYLLFANPLGALVAEMREKGGFDIADMYLNGGLFSSGLPPESIFPHSEGAAWKDSKGDVRVVGKDPVIHSGSTEGWRWHPKGFCIVSKDGRCLLNGIVDIGPAKASMPYRPNLETICWTEDAEKEVLFVVAEKSGVMESFAWFKASDLTSPDDWFPTGSLQVVAKSRRGETEAYIKSGSPGKDWCWESDATQPCFGVHLRSNALYEYGPDPFEPSILCLHGRQISLGKLGFTANHRRGIIAHEIGEGKPAGGELVLYVLN